MYLQRGLGKGFVMPLLATAMIASGAKAASVTYSAVFTNNTTLEKEYSFSKDFTLTSNLGNTGGSGSLAMVVTDIRGGGAYVKGVGSTSIFTSFVNNFQVSQLTPPSAVSAGQFGQSSYSIQYSTKNYAVLGNISDIIKTQFKFILSAGDQVVISSTFEVISYTPSLSNTPSPGALALIGISGGISLRGRRRSNYQ